MTGKAQYKENTNGEVDPTFGQADHLTGLIRRHRLCSWSASTMLDEMRTLPVVKHDCRLDPHPRWRPQPVGERYTTHPLLRLSSLRASTSRPIRQIPSDICEAPISCHIALRPNDRTLSADRDEQPPSARCPAWTDLADPNHHHRRCWPDGAPRRLSRLARGC